MRYTRFKIFPDQYLNEEMVKEACGELAAECTRHFSHKAAEKSGEIKTIKMEFLILTEAKIMVDLRTEETVFGPTVGIGCRLTACPTSRHLS